MTPSSQIPRFIDIGVNLTDPVFRGLYRGSRKHADDFNLVIKRSLAAGVQSMILTGGSLSESREALKLAKKINAFATVGCHPTRSKEFDKFKGGPKGYLDALDKVIQSNREGPGRVVAVGECGLDYDRLHFADEKTQQQHFRSQLALAKKHSLPLFLHSRAAHSDFVRILTEEGFGEDGGRGVGAKGGVVHSFTGSVKEIEDLTKMGFHFSINGCGMKTKQNLVAAKAIPLDKLMIETDAPWCSLTSTHASNPYLKSVPKELAQLYTPPSCKPDRFVLGQVIKGRNEPCAIGNVAHVLAELHEISLTELSEACWKNTVEVFGLEGLEGMIVPPGGEEVVEGGQGQGQVQKKEEKKEFDLTKEEWPSL